MRLKQKCFWVALWNSCFVAFATTMAAAQTSPAPGTPDISPLQTVLDGRKAAAKSMLTEEGVATMTQSAVNATLYICGAAAVILVAAGLWQLYVAQEAQNMMGTNDDARRAALWKIAIGGLISIPAIIAAIVPYNIL